MVAGPAASASLRVAFFGTPAFAVPTLEAILASRHTVVGVVTQPDRRRGRGQKVSDSAIKARASIAGLPVFQPDRINDPAFLATLTGIEADIGVVAAYGKILTEAVLSTPRLGMINVHASLLPKYRGAAPVHRAVMAGEAETGVTIMRVVKALDAGPMLATARRAIGPDDTSEQVERGLALDGAGLLVGTLDALAEGGVTEMPQDDRLATYAHRLTKDEGLIDWSQPAIDIHNQVRGLYPWPHAFSFIDSRRLILLRTSPEAGGTHPLAGTVVAAHGDELRVAAGDGLVRVHQLQAEGKRPSSARAFLSTRTIRVGDRFTASRS
ncbi:MAG: methionyl-tRNA formyltransferase [Luteitalea sp.]|nr:methionyl-tRNA formyltransferase [Luteitalea sp.]